LSSDYGTKIDLPLDRDDLDPDPVVQFDRWFERAAEVVDEPEAVCLATVDSDGVPDARMVLLKGAGPDGFRFFTNYEGVKASQLDANPAGAMVFFWPQLERQVRIRGPVERLSAADSDAYFASRGRNSRIGAWASPQSEVIPDSREELDRFNDEARERFDGVEDVPRPPHWGGFILRPTQFEFWQGRQARLHDRFRYRPDGSGWTIDRLAP
jgi:pyridoxamine 5'-phosphate oxidase